MQDCSASILGAFWKEEDVFDAGVWNDVMCFGEGDIKCASGVRGYDVLLCMYVCVC